MQYRLLGCTGLRVSAIGFGAWAIGGPFQVNGIPAGRGPVNDRESEAAILRALELGINFFDTADLYGRGHSETVLGRALRGRRGEVVVATKAGCVVDDAGVYRKDFSAAHLERACDASLHRLGTDYLDLYQLHGPPLEVLDRGEAEETLERLRSAGKIRHFGASIGHPSEGIDVVSRRFGSTLQVVFNVLNQKPAAALLPLAARAGYGVIARVPLASGLLAGIRPSAEFHVDDVRRVFLSPNRLAEVLPRVDRFLKLCDEAGVAPVHGALGFVLAHPAVSTTIPGPRSAAQVAESAGAPDTIPPTLLAHLRAEFGRENFYLKWGLEKVV